ncbi:hypothetical protein HPB47_027363 [Ixodes persulcatus]|uniref:Uncharacterized protein n=1 Tax=Ixodes persulcatus TaxID=34615 RepID=A0AC60PWF6_IXOPE|nr:hypothetical protein HPB47_027363 [Ixodes persulcatus]
MATQVGGMMRRIRNKRHGIKEKEAVQLVEAFIVSRLTYGTPYLKLNKTEMNKLNAILRKAYKNALGLPEWTATDKLLTLGVHNSMEELQEAQIIPQLKRLDATTNGKWLLDRLGMAVPGGTQVPEGEEEIDHDTRQKFKISKLPKNMHPERDEGRRRARTAAIAHSWDNREGTLYVDAAGPSLGLAAIAVASAQGKILRVASIRVDSAEQAEEAATALAVSCNPQATVINDSQKACRNYARGVLGRPALRILKKVQVQAMGVHLIWAPGHMGHTGNEAANAAARAALYRDSSPCPVEPAPDMPYNKYLATLRQVRKEFPAPHKSLSKKEEFIWRRLQTDTVTTPAKLHTWYPERFHSASCLFCGAPCADVHHLAWVCKKIPGLTPLEEPKKKSGKQDCAVTARLQFSAPTLLPDRDNAVLVNEYGNHRDEAHPQHECAAHLLENHAPSWVIEMAWTTSASTSSRTAAPPRDNYIYIRLESLDSLERLVEVVQQENWAPRAHLDEAEDRSRRDNVVF